MSAFPETSATLLAQIKHLSPGEDSAAWTRFWNLYAVAIRNYAVIKGGEAHADDILMVVLEKLVAVLREGKYDAEKGRFRAFLVTMIANEVHMAHRKDVVRCQNQHVSINNPEVQVEAEISALGACKTGEAIDEDWRKAVAMAAKEHVFSKTAVSARDREIFKMYEEGKAIEEIASAQGVSRNNASQIISRLVKRIAQVAQDMLGAES